MAQGSVPSQITELEDCVLELDDSLSKTTTVTGSFEPDAITGSTNAAAGVARSPSGAAATLTRCVSGTNGQVSSDHVLARAGDGEGPRRTTFSSRTMRSTCAALKESLRISGN